MWSLAARATLRAASSPASQHAAVVKPVVWSQLQLRTFGSKSGIVKFFNPERGFGFIESEGKDYFAHYTGIEGSGFRSLGDGEEVEFDVEVEASGKERAVRVTGPGGASVKGSTRERSDFNRDY